MLLNGQLFLFLYKTNRMLLHRVNFFVRRTYNSDILPNFVGEKIV